MKASILLKNATLHIRMKIKGKATNLRDYLNKREKYEKLKI